ncbi:T6SS immunity protein Tli4 family protein [Ralstonia solanacearum]|uniref:T6SS immunity protein Tli4 family protein n=1 Tax=Ralstonia solanacearum TaxID=305 RepID=UPI0005AC3ABD|nr:T6SS immunity protein Tli4 family protein [Ralstonia solanacearum]MDC6175844.1 T6SS immunity protein Tli4 family protein [Ralstonia solanacearum]MDC6208896.1 T6SS immunity protein Tli4 family protein [Ralstonia solanacearum]MDC6239239.1 T6SS immunity protein Tli4 family protein [Ralstonia solanacearum]MDD7801088.1 T6SS immunity protein Tli4 family protein [Ralstonia solanacearum]
MMPPFLQRLRRHARWTVLALLALIALTAYAVGWFDRTPESFRKPNMTELSPRLQPLFEKTKTVCFGRFLIDVPDTATVVFGPVSANDRIERLPDEGDKLDEYVAKRETELKGQLRYPRTKGLNRYEKTLDGAIPGQKIVVGFRDFDGSFFKVESYIRLGRDLYIQETEAPVEPYKITGQGPKKTVIASLGDAIEDLNVAARNLHARAEDGIPAAPGVCLDGAFLDDSSGWLTHETIPFGIRLKEFPDVHFSIQTIRNQGSLIESSALEPRLKKAEENASRMGDGGWYRRIKMLRRADRQIEGWTGYEALDRVPEQEDVRGHHDFKFMGLGHPTDPLRPELDVQMQTGVADNMIGKHLTSISDEEAVALWDKLTSTIRVRPVGVSGSGKAASNSPQPPHSPSTPLGELAATGRQCPQTGWWRCPDVGATDGGHRFIHEGQVMPQVAIVGKPTLWQRLKGDQPMWQAVTVWKLVSYAHDEPVLLAPQADGPTASANRADGETE